MRIKNLKTQQWVNFHYNSLSAPFFCRQVNAFAGGQGSPWVIHDFLTQLQMYSSSKPWFILSINSPSPLENVFFTSNFSTISPSQINFFGDRGALLFIARCNNLIRACVRAYCKKITIAGVVNGWFEAWYTPPPSVVVVGVEIYEPRHYAEGEPLLSFFIMFP